MGDDDLIRRGDALKIALAYASGEGAALAEYAIRAIPAADARAEALKDAASHVFVLLHNTPAYVDARTLRDLVPESILALIPEKQP